MTAERGLAKAPVSLKVIVVGAGLAGLGAACALRRAGHDVLVFEKSDGAARSPGGLRTAPNMTKILLTWGLKEELERIASSMDTTIFFDGETAEILGIAASEVVGQIRRDSDKNADFMMTTHGALYDLMYGLAKREGVLFRFNTTVTAADSEFGLISLEGGEEEQADLIVGADGCYSTLRRYVERGGSEEDLYASNAKNNMVHLNLTVPAECLVNDEEFSSWLDLTEWKVWMADGLLVSGHAHPSMEGTRRDYTIIITYPYQGEEIAQEDEDWRPLEDLSHLDLDLSKIEPRVQRMVGLAKHKWGRVFTLKPCLSGLDRSRLVLVGEAAHSIQPGGYLSSAFSFEDAHVLGTIFSMIESPSQVHRFLTAYDEIRLPRVSWAHFLDANHQVFLRLPPGPYRDMRDKQLRRTLVESSIPDEELAQLYGDDIKMYAYDTAVETAAWWNQYGSMVTSSGKRKESVVEIRVAEAVDVVTH